MGMTATKSIKIYPGTYKRLWRVAKRRRQAFAVVVDELSKQVDRHAVNPLESTGSDTGRDMSCAEPVAADSTLSHPPFPADAGRNNPRQLSASERTANADGQSARDGTRALSTKSGPSLTESGCGDRAADMERGAADADSAR